MIKPLKNFAGSETNLHLNFAAMLAFLLMIFFCVIDDDNDAVEISV